ncbi:DUF6804 family protein [Nonlabens antarcticus]|uniref:DUF6804 family protein n=1 Tax=Nonlabens antarcticus TaxID=392714 RepID=UPI001891F0AF|nr:DUF6804 family protein [Nonlabens antarcticus]
MEKIIKIILSILLLLCLIDMPYSYYEAVRFIAMVAFGYLAYTENAKGNQALMITYIVLALLFQPFFKLALGRMLWNVVDVIVAVGLVISIFIKPQIKVDDNKQNR